MFRLILSVSLVAVVLCGPAFPSLAAPISFNLELANPTTSVIRLENTSVTPAAQITAFTLSVGDPDWNFDIVGNAHPIADTGTALEHHVAIGDLDQDAVRTDLIRLDFTGFDPGDRFEVTADLDQDEGNTAADFRTVYFNNGPRPNAVATVDFVVDETSGRLRLSLPDEDVAGDPQRFHFDGAGTIITMPLVGFDLELANPSTSIFRITNTSLDPSAQIVRTSIFVGDTAWNFDVVAPPTALVDQGDTLATTILVGDTDQDNMRTDLVELATTGFGVGDRLQFSLDLDEDNENTGSDFRHIYFNNGARPNARVTVDFSTDAGPATLELELPDDALLGDPQRFLFAVAAPVPEPDTGVLLAVSAAVLLVGARGWTPRRKRN